MEQRLEPTVRRLRERELGMTDKPDRGRGTVSFPELRKGNVGIVVATQIARFVKPDSQIPGGILRSRPGRRHRDN